jgi:hypothetical protein
LEASKLDLTRVQLRNELEAERLPHGRTEADMAAVEIEQDRRNLEAAE